MGLLPGDIIIDLNGQTIASAGDLEQALAGQGGGSRVSLVLLRAGSWLTVAGILE